MAPTRPFRRDLLGPTQPSESTGSTHGDPIAQPGRVTVHQHPAGQARTAFQRSAEQLEAAAPDVATALRNLLAAVDRGDASMRAEGIEQLALLAAQCVLTKAARRRPTARALASALLGGVKHKLERSGDGRAVWSAFGPVVTAHLMNGA